MQSFGRGSTTLCISSIVGLQEWQDLSGSFHNYRIRMLYASVYGFVTISAIVDY